MVSRAGRVIGRAERLGERAAAALMLVIMVVVSADVVMRYAVHRPIAWAYDFISVYLVAAVFFFTLSSAYTTQHQVAVDILVRSLGPAGRRAAEALTCAVSLPLFALIAWVGGARAWAAWAHGDALAGLIAWPTWPALALVPLGAGLLALRLLTRLAGHVLTFVTGREVVAVAPMAGDTFVE